MDEEEIKILNKLYDEKHIVYSPEKIIVTRKFYNYSEPHVTKVTCFRPL